jgi:hypothetical protein
MVDFFMWSPVAGHRARGLPGFWFQSHDDARGHHSSPDLEVLAPPWGEFGYFPTYALSDAAFIAYLEGRYGPSMAWRSGSAYAVGTSVRLLALTL